MSAIVDLHVLDHALAKRGHARLLDARAWPIPGGCPGAYVRIGASNVGLTNWWEHVDARADDQPVDLPTPAKRVSAMPSIVPKMS
jgi:hypothetical protein